VYAGGISSGAFSSQDGITIKYIQNASMPVMSYFTIWVLVCIISLLVFPGVLDLKEFF